jgi:hypothetical protein
MIAMWFIFWQIEHVSGMGCVTFRSPCTLSPYDEAKRIHCAHRKWTGKLRVLYRNSRTNSLHAMKSQLSSLPPAFSLLLKLSDTSYFSTDMQIIVHYVYRYFCVYWTVYFSWNVITKVTTAVPDSNIGWSRDTLRFALLSITSQNECQNFTILITSYVCLPYTFILSFCQIWGSDGGEDILGCDAV